MDKPRKYEAKYKQEAVKLAKEIGAKKASEELKIPYGTLYDWIKKERKGVIEIKRLTEMNEFLEEASAFFAARRQKSGKSKD